MSDCRNPHLSAYDRAAQEDRERSRAADSREKLEEDATNFCERFYTTEKRYNELIELLDRQAAITTQECTDVYETGCEACRSAQKRKIAELQEQLDTMRDVTREFRDERDEWKAKAKKRDFKDEMADLLFRIQMPLNEQREYLKKVSQDSEMDSRERLEAEIRYEYNGSISNEADQIIEWLDRQAAITERETIERNSQNWHDWCEELGIPCVKDKAGEQFRAMQDEIAELKADNDYLRDRNGELDYEVRDWKGEAKTQRNNFEQATESRKHWQRKYESVKAERDELKSKADALEADKASWQSGYHIDRLAKLQTQRDRYRDLLSKAVDEAQSIVKLMEVES